MGGRAAIPFRLPPVSWVWWHRSLRLAPLPGPPTGPSCLPSRPTLSGSAQTPPAGLAQGPGGAGAQAGKSCLQRRLEPRRGDAPPGPGVPPETRQQEATSPQQQDHHAQVSRSTGLVSVLQGDTGRPPGSERRSHIGGQRESRVPVRKGRRGSSQVLGGGGKEQRDPQKHRQPGHGSPGG